MEVFTRFYCFLIIAYLSHYPGAGLCSPIADSGNEPEALVSIVEVEQEVASDAKAVPPFLQLPAFLTQNKPLVAADAQVVGEVGTLHANNNSTLTAISGPNQTSMVSLNSVSSYAAVPVMQNFTSSDVKPDGSSESVVEALSGFSVMVEEYTQAAAQGEQILFQNQGGSYATGFGESLATGLTENQGPSGVGSGWKNPSDEAKRV